jgi:hypothetical protein
VRGQILDDLQAKSGSMGQKAAGIWTAQTDSQTGRAKSDGLPEPAILSIAKNRVNPRSCAIIARIHE